MASAVPFATHRQEINKQTRSNRVNCGGLNNIKPGIHAIVEATVMPSEGVAGSELFDVLTTEEVSLMMEQCRN